MGRGENMQEGQAVKKDLNMMAIVGRLTADAELKHTNGGTPVLSGTIANNYMKGGQDEVNFFEFDLYGKGAEAIATYMTKGKQVGVKGRLQQDRWEQDGKKRSKVVLILDEVQFLGGGERDSGSHQQRSAPIPQEGPADDEVPF